MSTNAHDIRLTYGIPLASEFESKMKDTELYDFEMKQIARAFEKATSRVVTVKLEQRMSEQTFELLGQLGYRITCYHLVYQITPKAATDTRFIIV